MTSEQKADDLEKLLLTMEVRASDLDVKITIFRNVAVSLVRAGNEDAGTIRIYIESLKEIVQGLQKDMDDVKDLMEGSV